jgi:PhzF family phenazine biosynthesis protein
MGWARQHKKTMKPIPIYQVDAFSDRVFGGNPAAVCPLEEWIPDNTMQRIAQENNLAETAFFVKEGGDFRIRWFTPTVEVDLCGHATLASAHVLFNHEHLGGETVVFSSRSGRLSVTRRDNLLVLDFPADALQEVELSPSLAGLFTVKPIRARRGKTDYMLIFENEEQIVQTGPDLALIASLPVRGVIITAPGRRVDFVSRFFAPQSGVNEDPVTGSAHTSLIPYWANVLGKQELTAEQLSSRRGLLFCRHRGNRVEIGGHARTYLSGTIGVE